MYQQRENWQLKGEGRKKGEGKEGKEGRKERKKNNRTGTEGKEEEGKKKRDKKYGVWSWCLVFFCFVGGGGFLLRKTKQKRNLHKKIPQIRGPPSEEWKSSYFSDRENGR